MRGFGRPTDSADLPPRRAQWPTSGHPRSTEVVSEPSAGAPPTCSARSVPVWITSGCLRVLPPGPSPAATSATCMARGRLSTSRWPRWVPRRPLGLRTHEARGIVTAPFEPVAIRRPTPACSGRRGSPRRKASDSEQAPPHAASEVPKSARSPAGPPPRVRPASSYQLATGPAVRRPERFAVAQDHVGARSCRRAGQPGGPGIARGGHPAGARQPPKIASLGPRAFPGARERAPGRPGRGARGQRTPARPVARSAVDRGRGRGPGDHHRGAWATGVFAARRPFPTSSDNTDQRHATLTRPGSSSARSPTSRGVGKSQAHPVADSRRRSQPKAAPP